MFPRIPQRLPHESRLSSRRSRVARTSRCRPARRARRFARRQPRRGVLLLVVLSVLVLFLMIGTAFVITAKQSEKSAKSAHKAASRLSSEAAQTDLLEEVLLQVLRDTNNPSSNLRGHSLLGDMYGTDGVKTSVAGASWASAFADGSDPTGGQILELQLNTGYVQDLAGIDVDGYGNFFDVNNPPTPPPARFSPYENAYNGQVLTFLSGVAKSRSTRIVGFIPPNRLRVMNFTLADGTLISNPATQLGGSSRVLINGRPFSGTGVGFNRAAAADDPKLTLLEQLNLDADATPLLGELALLPNNAFLNLSSLIGNKSRLWQVRGTSSSDAPALFDGAGFLLSGAQLAAYGDSSNINHVSRRLELSRQIGPAGFGGSNESYDAVDFQNMALALIPGAEQLAETNVTVAQLADVSPTAPALPSMLSTPPPVLPGADPAKPLIIPSWHRPELVNYWANRLPIDTNSPFSDSLRGSSFAGHALALRRVLMRPNWLDHPDFTGSNPEFAAIPSGIAGWGQKLARMVYGPWDVDNDNDGYRDSVWVDVGLPVMAGPNGKLVKPLAAILIVDMDGRLNVNAHGTCDLAEAWPNNGSETGLTALTETTLLADPAGAMRSDVMPQGMGYGPAEISLRWAITPENFRRVLTGTTVNGKFIPGRYGFPESGTIRPGQVNQFDYLSQIGMNGWPDRANILSNFGTPPDLRARYSVGLNKIGQAIFESTLASAINRTNTSDDLIVDSPYELNLSQKTAAGIQGYENLPSTSDAPFSIAELERVLRVYDVDAGALPSRLAGLAGVQGASGDPRRRLKLTTDSYAVPAPNVSLPHEMESLVTSNPLLKRQPKSAAELMEIRVRAALFPPRVPANAAKMFPLPLTDATESNAVRAIVRRLLAPELANGTRLNINRPFGNGRDDNDNGVVDEPGEYEGVHNDNGPFEMGTRPETDVWKNISGGSRPASLGDFATPRFPQLAAEIQPDAGNPDGKVGVVDHRHLMARHLYTLALTLTAEADFGTREPTTEDQEFARRLAQWAVNVVDFRDPDNIMTPFEYDVNPFDGWDVDGFVGAVPGRDGILGTADDDPALDGDGDGKTGSKLPGRLNGQTLGPEHRGLVWGVERPELVMTETLAWHDRRTDDSASEDVYAGNGQFTGTVDASVMDPTDPDADKDFDQLVQPRGAFFVELYNPWAPNPAANADTHRRVNNNDLGVDLAAVSVDPDPVDVEKPNSPVWRMAVAKRTVGNQSIQEADAAQWDPDHPDDQLRPYKTHDIKFDRTIYFSGMPGNDSYQGAAYHDNIDSTRNMRAPSVRPGRYMVVGSGKQIDAGIFETPIADRKGARNLNQRKPQRRIELVTDMAAGADLANRVRVLDCIADPVAAQLRDPAGQYNLQSPADDGTLLPMIDGDAPGTKSMSDVVIIDMVSINGQDSVRRRLSVTEPAIGYPTKIGDATWNSEKEQYEAQGASRALDIPLDGPLGGQDALDAQPIDWPYKYPIDPILTEIRGAQPQSNSDPRGDTGAFYAHVYLQRLANPLLPWNPEPGHPDHRPTKPVNPYLTVDTMPTNVSVYNSRGNDEGKEEPDGDNPDGKQASEPRNYFSSVQRGFTAALHRKADTQFVPSLWSREAPSLVRTRPGKAAQDMLTTPANSYNRMRLEREDDNWFNAVPMTTLGFLNHSLQDKKPAAVGTARQIVPDQTKTFEWMTWNNRPFVSGNEMLLVPRLRSSQLTQQFSNAENGAANWSEYELPVSPEPAPQAGAQPITPFRHMAGFFYEEKDGETPPAGVPLHLYRILEYVHTPSLYVGAETWTNPQNFNMPLSFPATTRAELDPRISMRPPFNVVSEFREPGRINLNTIPINTVKDQPDAIWNGLFHGNPDRKTPGAGVHAGPTKDEFFASRRGYGGATIGDPLLNPEMPTMFANPFRAPDTGTFVPLPQMVRKGVDLGLLRSDKPTVDGPGADALPLFTADSAQPYTNTKRNPFFRYQPITRLDNLTTIRSNVYAVWVTIGFFEVAEADWATAKQENFNNDINLFKRVYPDGYHFGREDGVDVGNIRRLRGFYMIDRSKMAGFEPGADHNVENTVRLRRRIE